MFTQLLWAGAVLGLAIGIAHAIHIYHTQSVLAGTNSKSMAFYRAAWALGLWTLFGGYLLVMWIAGALLRPLLGMLTKTKQPA